MRTNKIDLLRAKTRLLSELSENMNDLTVDELLMVELLLADQQIVNQQIDTAGSMRLIGGGNLPKSNLE